MWNVIGQPGAVELLRHSLDIKRLAHAYLFVGRAHVGKMTLAVCLAQALNCERGSEPCGQCRPCRRIAESKHADVQILSRLADDGKGTKKNISIDQIRALQQSAGLQPYEGRHRVFIIDGAEHLNEEAANCLLKTLEEPSPNVLIILLAASGDALLATIISRCQSIELRPVPAHIIEQALVELREVEPERARLLSRACRGAIGWSFSATDDEKLMTERSRRLEELQGVATSGLNQRFTYAAKLATQFAKSRETAAEILGLWLDWWRDILLTKEGCDQFITNIDHEAELRRCAEAYSLTGIRDFIKAIRTACHQLEQNANARLALEVLMLNVPAGDQDRERERGVALPRQGLSV